MKILISLLFALLALPAAAQTVATCPSATAGTVWAKGAWLPCNAVVYVALPPPGAAKIARMHCAAAGCTFSWDPPSAFLAGDSAWQVTPAKPSGTWAGLPAAAAPTSIATLTWTQPTLDVNGNAAQLTGDKVYRGHLADGSDLALLASIPPAATFSDGGLTVGTWCYAISAVNAFGESDKSGAACKVVATPGGIPQAPTGLK